jgi:group II intron reverse transcriptase/maturase
MSMTQSSDLILNGILAVALPCKLSDLPDVTKTRGPEHVTNVMDWDRGTLYDPLLNTVLHDPSIYACGALDNPFSSINTDIIISSTSGQSGDEATIITLRSHTIKTSTGSKKYVAYKESTTGFPKGSNSYGDGALILVTWGRVHSSHKVGQRTFSTSSVAAVSDNPEYISGSDLKAGLKKRNGKYYGLFKMISNKDVLFLASVAIAKGTFAPVAFASEMTSKCSHSNKNTNNAQATGEGEGEANVQIINSKPGDLTPGIDNDTLDGLSPEFFKKLSIDLRSENFQFKPTRRLCTPKPNGKMRPLGIPSPRDKVVQKAMEIILNLVFEPLFLDTSHGFRPERSCHSALKQVSKWNGYESVIEGDIKGNFDNIHHTILANLLEKEIKDQQFMDLYWKLARAGYVEYKYVDSNLGVPQGGILSPLLSNIYLHEFDLFMSEYISKYTSKKKNISKVKPKIVTDSKKLTNLHKLFIANAYARDPNILKDIRSLREERNTIPTSIRTDNRVSYVRYADDWMIGVIGTREVAKKIKEDAKLFLEYTLKLGMSAEKTKVTSLTEDKARFLGVEIYIPKAKQTKVVYKNMDGRSIPLFNLQQMQQGKQMTIKNQVRVKFLMPYKEILQDLAKEGFLKEYSPGGKLITNAITKWIFLEHSAIIIRYNSIINGYLNYYSFVDNLHRFHTIINYILKHSCAKTLARKFRLGSRAGAFKKFGSNLGTEGKNSVALKIPTSYVKSKKV